MSRGQDQELAGEVSICLVKEYQTNKFATLCKWVLWMQADLYLTGQVEVVLLPPVGACCGYQLLYNVAG